MRYLRTILLITAAALLLGVVVWLSRMPATLPRANGNVGNGATQPARGALRLGIIPERDIFEQRKRHQALAEYLSAALKRPVELKTASSYQAVLQDFAEKQVEAAFLGSLVSVLAQDRHGARVVAKPELAGGVSTYRGVIFVNDDSPISSVEDLAGRTLAMVRTTTGGNLFPMYELHRRGMLHGPNPPRFEWCGTHDEVVTRVLEKRVDAGAVKDLRLMDLEWAFGRKARRLATGEQVPENALVLRGDVARELGEQLGVLLLGMEHDARGREALRAFGAVRFVPCNGDCYQAIYEMVAALGPAWNQLGIAGPPPKPRTKAGN